MRALLKRTDIHFSGDDIHRFLPWMIGVMACLTTLLLCLTISMNSWIVDRQSNYTESFTVNVPPSVKSPEKITQLKDALQKTSGVKNVKEVSEQELQRTLKNWLGSGDVSALPLPAVLEITLAADQLENFDHAAVQKKMSELVPGTEVDAHEQWVATFAHFSGVAQFLLILLALLIIAAMGTAVIFTSRTALRLHARSVALLHSIGAEDEYITRQFQQDAFVLVLPGLLAGALVAGLIYWAGGAYMASLPVSMLPSLAMGTGHIALLILLPAVCSSAACVVARLAVMSQLRHTL